MHRDAWRSQIAAIDPEPPSSSSDGAGEGRPRGPFRLFRAIGQAPTIRPAPSVRRATSHINMGVPRRLEGPHCCIARGCDRVAVRTD